MKFRVAKKIVFSKLWRDKLQRMDRYRPYIDDEGKWVFPSFHPHPVKAKAWTVYIKHKSRNKRRIYSL